MVGWLLTHARDRAPSDAPPPAPPRTDSKRKAARPQRWRGMPAPFAWAPAALAAPAPVARPPLQVQDNRASLLALVEALADQLCVLQLSTVAEAALPRFGSSARLCLAHDERDEVQWFCADVMEAAYARSLPQVCALLRIKFFGPGPGAAASKPRALKRTMSVPSHATSGPTLAAAPAAAPAAASAAAPAAAPSTAPAVGPAADLHPILTAAQTERRRGVSATTRPAPEVHMSRRLSRTTSASHAAPSSASLSQAGPAPRDHKRKRPASRWSGGAASTTLVMATPKRSRMAAAPGPSADAALSSWESSPASSPPGSPSLHRSGALAAPPPSTGDGAALQLGGPDGPPRRAAWARQRSAPAGALPPPQTAPPLLPLPHAVSAARASPHATSPAAAAPDADESDVEWLVPAAKRTGAYDPLSLMRS